MLDNYHLLLASLDESETLLLETHLSDLKRSIRPGAKRLNWTSLGIQDYLNKTNSVDYYLRIPISSLPFLIIAIKIFKEYLETRING
jgi:hypothetical protein